jgi:3-hydroxypropanoate dehydrogenase
MAQSAGRDAMTGRDGALDSIFRDARTHRSWLDRPVADGLLTEIYELAKMGPTSANCCPLRIVFVKSARAKQRLRPYLSRGNLEQTMAAPITAIFAHDTRFFEHMPMLAPHAPHARSWFEGDENAGHVNALRNGSLQAAYFMLAARAKGLDCGPMSGFDQKALDADFFPDGRFQSNFLCNLGYGDPSRLHPRAPRFDFDEVCRID